MNLKSFSRLATVSAIALGFAGYSGSAFAAPYQMDDPATPLQVPVDAYVLNTVDVVITTMTFPDIGVHGDAADVATLVMDATGAIALDDLGPGAGGAGEAHMQSGTNAGQQGVLTITGALVTSSIFVYYTNLQDLVNGVNPHLELAVVGPDDLATPGSCTAGATPPAAGVCDAQVVGIGLTDAAGALTVNIGASIRTVSTALPYLTGTYSGTFDVVMTY